MILFRRVVGVSMRPTLNNGQITIILKTLNIRDGDIVMAKIKNSEVIKRVTSLDRYKVFLEGDNKNHSTDSRHYGAVPISNIIGRLIYPRNIQF